jgi:hypothetical protein
MLIDPTLNLAQKEKKTTTKVGCVSCWRFYNSRPPELLHFTLTQEHACIIVSD